MTFSEINKQAYIRDAVDLLNQGKADEAVALFEQNIANGQMTITDRLVYACCLDAVGKKYDAVRELMSILSVDHANPAAIELLMNFYKEFNNPIGDYYQGKLNELMAFSDRAENFWKNDEHHQVDEDSGDEVEISEKPIDKESLIKSINNMLGEEADKIWPFETKTLAELFIKQGHYRRGLAVYGRLLKEPECDENTLGRVNELVETYSRGKGDRIRSTNNISKSDISREDDK